MATGKPLIPDAADGGAIFIIMDTEIYMFIAAR
jgi:hypothetical protein